MIPIEPIPNTALPIRNESRSLFDGSVETAIKARPRIENTINIVILMLGPILSIRTLWSMLPKNANTPNESNIKQYCVCDSPKKFII